MSQATRNKKANAEIEGQRTHVQSRRRTRLPQASTAADLPLHVSALFRLSRPRKDGSTCSTSCLAAVQTSCGSDMFRSFQSTGGRDPSSHHSLNRHSHKSHKLGNARIMIHIGWKYNLKRSFFFYHACNQDCGQCQWQQYRYQVTKPIAESLCRRADCQSGIRDQMFLYLPYPLQRCKPDAWCIRS